MHRKNKFKARSPLIVGALMSFIFVAVALRAAETSFAPGITEPFLDVGLSASVPGIVAARKFKEGDLVKEGEVLIELDKRLEELETERRKLVRDQKRSDFESTRQLLTTTKGISKEDVEK